MEKDLMIINNLTLFPEEVASVAANRAIEGLGDTAVIFAHILNEIIFGNYRVIGILTK